MLEKHQQFEISMKSKTQLLELVLLLRAVSNSFVAAVIGFMDVIN